MKVTVVKGKASVVVLNWGNAPFAKEQTKRGTAYIPSDFTVEAFSDSKVWIGRTRVQNGFAQYQFFEKCSPNKKSEWRANPTAAYKDANLKVGNPKFVPGSNGRLIIGVTYDNLQTEILNRFGSALDISPRTPDGTFSSPVPSSANMNYLQTPPPQAVSLPPALPKFQLMSPARFPLKPAERFLDQSELKKVTFPLPSEEERTSLPELLLSLAKSNTGAPVSEAPHVSTAMIRIPSSSPASAFARSAELLENAKRAKFSVETPLTMERLMHFANLEASS